MRNFLFLLLLLGTTSLLNAQFRLVLDANVSSVIGAENGYSANQGLHYLMEQLLPNRFNEEETFGQKLAGVSYRIAKMALVDAHFDLTIHLLQHEFFGHGYRYREFEIQNNSFEINLYPPYGPGGGFAFPGTPLYPRDAGVHEGIAINAGGMEAAAVLSQTIKNKWLVSGQIPYRDWLLHTAGLLDQTGYIYTTRWFEPGTGNDVVNYVKRINQAYGFETPEEYQLKYTDLEKRSLINFVNTYQLLAFYTFLKTYLLDGEEALKLPMFQIGHYRWLPAVRFGLTPFGSEFFVENDILIDDKRFSFYGRFGDRILAKFWGVGGSHYRPLSDRLIVQGQLDFWQQPSMTLGGSSVFHTKGGWGTRLAVSCDYQLHPAFPIGVYAQLGYKTAGHIPGEMLAKGPVLRVGLSYVP